MKVDWDKIQRLASGEISSILNELPASLGEEVEKIPILFEKIPSNALIADGIDPDTLGIFTGAEFAEEGTAVLPAQIVLFLENIWNYSSGNEEAYRSEIRTTFLHELGHFLGLDEDDLMRRGLE